MGYIVLHHLVLHRATPVLLSPTNDGSLENILQTMSHAAIHVEDASVKRTCIRFFRELVEQWSGPNASSSSHQEQ